MREIRVLLLSAALVGVQGCAASEGSSAPTISAGGVATGGGSSQGGTPSGSGGAAGSGAVPAFAPCTGDAATFEAFAAKVWTDLQAHGVTGGGLSVVCGGATVFATGLGNAKKGGPPVTRHTRFQIASNTKTLTAAAALRLAEQGVLGIDDPVAKWLPVVNTSKPYAQGFTLAQLLSHTSGYPAGIDTALYQDLKASFEANAGVELWAPPGAVFNYSNDGYAMAGLVLETATGKPFGELIETEVMKPAGMLDARMDAAVVKSEGNYAVGDSSWDGQSYEPTDGYLAMPYYGPMGGAWASADDLAALAVTFLSGGGGLFGQESLAKMSAARTPTAWEARSYGLGLFVDELGEVRVIGHSGSVAGFLSSYSIVPSRGLAVALVVNSDAYMPYASDLLDQVALAFSGSALPAATPIPYDAKLRAEHAGNYQSNTLGAMAVSDVGSQMQLVFGGQTMALVPTWRDSYYFNYQSMDLDATFWRENGAVKYLVTPYGVGARQP